MDYSPATASGLSKQAISDIAESTADSLSFNYNDDLMELIARLGGRIDIADTLLCDPDKSGSLYVDGLRDFRIVLPSHTSIEHDRFTVAHEFGHYLLHYVLAKRRDPENIQRILAFRWGNSRVEWEANWFATAFLMPRALFSSYFKKMGGNIYAVSGEFQVTLAKARSRSKELGLTA